MTEHWRLGFAFVVVSVLAAILGLVYSPVVGVVAILFAIVGWFVAAAAWMRPKGYEEHDDEPKTAAGPTPQARGAQRRSPR